MGDSLALHVQLTSTTDAVVFDGTAAYDFSVEQGASALGADEVTATDPTAPSLALRGPILLRAKQPLGDLEAGIDTIAVNLQTDGTLGSRALVLRAEGADTGCFQGGLRPHHWLLAASTVMPDSDETRVNVVPLLGDTPLGVLPWAQLWVQANKPTGHALQDQESTLAPGQRPVTMTWSDDASTTYQAIGSIQDWASVAGASLALTGRVTNTNGTGVGGVTDWLALVKVLDFGASRTSAIDWSQGGPSDLVTWRTQVLKDDSRCASDAAPAARACLRIGPGGGLALRYAGPLQGLRVVSREDVGLVSSNAPQQPALTATLAPANGAAVDSTGDGDHPFDPVVEDVFVVLQVPSFQPTSTTCTVPVTAEVYLDAIEPVAP